MSAYLIPIQTALLLFPFLAVIITLPYIIMQYRTYGSILPIRVLIVYSFIFYLLCAYFLVFLPLPPIEEVAAYTSPTMQLIPFASLKEFSMSSSLVWNDPSTYLVALNEPSLYLILCNILLTVPFGVYLRYYFQCNWKKTLLFTFLLTLSFECLQLSALFGIYPRPYRLFDVDDLITNTLGGMLGYAITPIFSRFLVSRERMDEKAYDRGRRVSPLRRVLAFLFDNLSILLTCTGVIVVLFHLKDEWFVEHPLRVLALIYVTALLFYLLLIPMCTQGKTIGKGIVNIHLVSNDGTHPKWYQYLFHFLLLYLLVLPTPCYVFYCLLSFLTQQDGYRWLWIVRTIGMMILYLTTLYQCMLSLFNRDYLPWYDRLFPLRNVSSIHAMQEDKESEEKEQVES